MGRGASCMLEAPHPISTYPPYPIAAGPSAGSVLVSRPNGSEARQPILSSRARTGHWTSGFNATRGTTSTIVKGLSTIRLQSATRSTASGRSRAGTSRDGGRDWSCVEILRFLDSGNRTRNLTVETAGETGRDSLAAAPARLGVTVCGGGAWAAPGPPPSAVGVPCWRPAETAGRGRRCSAGR